MASIESQIGSVVDSILQDYSNGRAIDRLELYGHPDKAVIVDIIDKLLRLVYPGYSQDRTYRI